MRCRITVGRNIQAHLRGGKGIRKVARECGVGTGTVQRVLQEMKATMTILVVCGCINRTSLQVSHDSV